MRLFRGQGVGPGGVGFTTKPKPREEPRDPAGDALDDAPDFVILWWRQGKEPHAGLAVAQVDAIEGKSVEVEVEVEVEGVAEALDEGHGASRGPATEAA
jgi:hypothetical protein